MSRKIRALGPPSASFVIAVVALFCALGGVGYAAFHVPANSVGTAQLKSRAVTSGKIRPHAVGIRRINTKQVQARVTGTCPSGNAIGAVQKTGRVTCNSAAPREFGASATAHSVGTASATIVSKSLGKGPYLLFANPYAVVSGATAGSAVQVSCTLSATNDGTGQTRSVQLIGSTRAQEVAIPLQAPATIKSPGGTATVTCKRVSTGAATISIDSALNALQTQSNG